MSVRAFVARYASRCAKCDKKIKPGDWCGYDGDDLLCDTHAEEA